MSAPLSACWCASDAKAIFVTEALEGDDAIFLATHTPMEGFDIAGRDAAEFGEANEQAVLETLTDPTRQHAFCVVQGEPGSGKSHLVRWLSLNWRGSSDIKLLLRRADGSLEGALRQLKERLPSEFSGLFDNLGQRHRATLEGRANNFLGILANSLEPGYFEVPPIDEKWCREYEPAKLLAHETIRSRWKSPSRILGLLEGKGGDRNSESASFNLDDIEHLANLASPLRMSLSLGHAQELCRRLHREAETIREFKEQGGLAEELAKDYRQEVRTSLQLVDALNRRRNEAIQNVLGVSAQRLKTLFREVREKLAERGQRLVLLLEDITSWEGLDDSLIDVLVFNATARGDHDARDVCPLISVVGVTPAYYEKLPGNYRQRITHEVRLGHSTGGLQDVATLRAADTRRKFAARYLSAVRAGTAALTVWSQTLRSGRCTPPPNPCDSCPRRSACFDVFGSEDSVGLFPFTPNAFDRFFEALKENDNGQTWKTPRGILQAILSPNLSKPNDLAEGIYPGSFIEPTVFRPERCSGTALSYGLEQIVLKRIELPEEVARMRRMLSYWGNPESFDTSVADGELVFAGARRVLFEAFGLPWIGANEASDDAVVTVEPPVEPEPVLPETEETSTIGAHTASPTRIHVPARPSVPRPKPKRLTQNKSELEQQREEIRGWSTTGTIENPSRWNKQLHYLISTLVDDHKLGLPSVLVSRMVTVDMVKLQGSTSASRDYLWVSAEPWVRNGLEAYLALKLDSNVRVQSAVFHRRNLATMMRNLERSVLDYLDRRVPKLPHGARWSPVATFAQILLARAWLRGVVGADASIQNLIQTVLSDEADPESDFDARCSPWQDWLNATSRVHTQLREDLREMVGLSINDGSGGSPLIDASELVGAVVRFKETGKFDAVPETEGALPPPFKRACELATLWEEKRLLIERTETSQITNRAKALSDFLRGNSIATHLERLDRCITGISALLPHVSADQVAAWKQAYGRLKKKLEQGAGSCVEDLICAIEAEIPVRSSLRLAWLARAPARDLEDFRSTAQLGEKVIEVLREHAGDCVREAGGTGSLERVQAIGIAIKAAVIDKTMAAAAE
jgi:hypothetical protein